MARNFTMREKENIRNGLREACKESWTRYGYKKTSVDELCRQTGISKGSFYLFFDSKESLFCEVLLSVQKQIRDAANMIMEKQKDKFGAAEALKHIYREYDENNFLYDSNGADFTIFLSRLPEEKAKQIEESNNMNREIFLKPYLNFKYDTNLSFSVIYSLIMNIKNKDSLPYNHMETFDFMADKLIDDLYE